MTSKLFIGLMSGTSLDGVDAVIVEFPDASNNEIGSQPCQLIHTHFVPYSLDLRTELLALHVSSENELERTALAGNQLSRLYAQAVQQLLQNTHIDHHQITAIGCHGQTIRHRPELGFTMQIGNPALLAELTGINVVADFRSRDIAAGGQGAPLVPAFHQAVFADTRIHRVIINIGGIANLTNLPANGLISGFDSGPGNMLMDAWAEQHLGKAYDESGSWAATGQVIDKLLDAWLAHPFFEQAPPKSTGRDMFNLAWLTQKLQPGYAANDVQRTLLELSAQTIATAVRQHYGAALEIYLCGGGAHNKLLVERLQQLLHPVKIATSNLLGISVDWVEAAAFAWLAKQALQQKPANLPAVTGANGARILGAIYAS
ncbi:MAG TPA: anhydro-N-acetylmuramic acid kinase [Methylophilaceae bacterium]